MIEKGSELAGRLMKDDSVHPLVKDTLIKQQQEIFFLRKSQMEQAQVIEQLVDNLATVINANDAMLKQYKKVIDGNSKALRNDETLSSE
jgi:hypothetical protein